MEMKSDRKENCCVDNEMQINFLLVISTYRQLFINSMCFFFHSNDFKEKRQHSCIMRTLIVLNLFLIIAIALSIAVMFRFAAVIQESKTRSYASACISGIFSHIIMQTVTLRLTVIRLAVITFL